MNVASQTWNEVVKPIAILFIMSLVTCAVVLPRLHIGPEKFASPSFSSSGARWSGIFVRQGAVKEIWRDPAFQNFEIGELWIEDIVERYDRIPIRRRIAGQRLCLSAKCDQMADVVLASGTGGVIQQTGKQRCWSGDQVVLVLGGPFVDLEKANQELYVVPHRGAVLLRLAMTF